VLLVWDENAQEDFLWWQAQDRKVLKRINALLADIQRNGNEGIGKPEALKHNFAGHWFRRITDEHRLVYKVAMARSASLPAATTTADCGYRPRGRARTGRELPTHPPHLDAGAG
jgi:toxin YoeB